MPEQTQQPQAADAQQVDDAAQIERPSQYPTATLIENGIAYDVSGKALGRLDGQAAQQKDDDFFIKLGGKPVKPQSQEETKNDEFFMKLGGTPVQTAQQDPRNLKPTVEKLADIGEYSTTSQADAAQYLRQHAAQTPKVVGKYADGSPVYEGDYVSPGYHREHPGEKSPVINIITAGQKPGTITVHNPLVMLPGESFDDFMKRAIEAGKKVTPEQIDEEHEQNLINAPATLATAAALGRVGPVIYAGAKGVTILKRRETKLQRWHRALARLVRHAIGFFS